MDRRGFLARVLAGGTGLALVGVDLDRLLWVQGARTYFDLHRARPLLFHAGDVFVIEGWFERDLLSGLLLPRLQQFVATADIARGAPSTIIRIDRNRVEIRPANKWWALRA